MRKEEFCEALEVMKPAELSPEAKAWAEYWKRKNESDNHWKNDVVVGLQISGFLTILGTLLLLPTLLGSTVPPQAVITAILWWFGLLVGGTSMMLGGLLLFPSVATLAGHLSYRRRIPPLPPGYSDEIGEVAQELRGKISLQNLSLSYAAEVPDLQDEIETKRVQVEGYRLAITKDVGELAEPDNLKERFARLENEVSV